MTPLARYAAGSSGLIAAVIVAAGCSVRISTSPMLLPPAPSPPLQPQTVISADITASISRGGQDLESEIQPSFSTVEECVALGFLCATGYVGHEPIRGLMFDNRLQLRSMLHYEIDANTPLGQLGSCGRPDNPKRRLDLSLDADLVVEPSWNLKLDRVERRVNPRDRCVLLSWPFATDRTDDVVRALERVLDGLPAKANEKFGPRLKTEATKVWNALQTPINLDERAWLEIRPDGIAATPPAGTGETVGMRLAIVARPRLTIGGVAPPPATRPLPDLRLEEISKNFRIVPHVLVPLDTIEAALRKLLVGQKLTRRYPLWPDPHVEITDVHIKEAAGDLMMFGVDVTGSVKGTLWLLTHLVYDQQTRRAQVQLLDYEVRTSNVLVWAASWLYPALLDRVVRSGFSVYSYDLGPGLDALAATVRAGLNRPLGADVSLETELIDGIVISGPFTEGRSFGFAAEMNGRARVVVRRAGDAVPTGREIRYVSVFFETAGQDKDAEEPVDVTVEHNGKPVAHRSLGITERWGNRENQGPFVFRLPIAMNVTRCSELTLRVRKAPKGSETGKSWVMKMTATLIKSDGSAVLGAISPESQWGDDEPFDRRFGLCQGTPAVQ